MKQKRYEILKLNQMSDYFQTKNVNVQNRFEMNMSERADP